jgi:sulfite reductase (NADPH) flavoprotein alpha-component
MTYHAGDSLGIYPTNRAVDVDEILQRLGATGAELVLPPILRLKTPIPLREALLERLALAKPGRPFLEALARKVVDPAEKRTLEALLAAEQKHVLMAFLEAREFVDLLAEFPSAQLTADELLQHLRNLQPRLYSIASSPRLHPATPHLTIAIVRYSTNGRSRAGVCSTFLADRVPLGEAVVPAFVAHSHFRLPEDAGKDCIMVGPGTGIAPFRAFLQERVATGAKGRNWIFFGDQRRGTDFLYEEEWHEYLAKGQLNRLDTAFSRDQAHKIYVQDRMRENAAMLWSWIQGGAHFYVCGDAKRMAKDVDVALHEVIAEEGRLSHEQAVEYVKEMKRERRYQRDVY